MVLLANQIRELPPDELAPIISWDDFRTYVLNWQQGQHIGLIGPTESGKSTLTYGILPDRKYVTFFATKPADPVLEQFTTQASFERIPTWPPTRRKWWGGKRPARADESPRRLLWPGAASLDSISAQRRQFHRATSDIYSQGGWTVVWDEFWMMCQILKMEQYARILLQQARSNDISFVMGAQRPSRIPLELYDQATHLIFFRDNDEVNLKRISGVGYLASGPIRGFVSNLEPYQILYINTRKGWMYRTTAPELALSGNRG